MNLHSIASGATTALVWFSPIGGNGAPIGPAAQKGLHLYRVQRSTPPEGRNRTYWNPWRTPVDADPKRPICGAIRSTARFPHLTYWAWPDTKCAECRKIADNGGMRVGTLNEIQAADPWQAILRDLRATTADPVTGL
jgi:hypothetical protein